jgi:diaminopimelate decarboxylase
MHHFQYINQQLYVEDLPVATIAQQVGTPLYLYSHATLTHHFRTFDQAFRNIPHLICFSAKSNSNLAILHLFGQLGGGVDIVSGGELYRALQAGVPAGRIVYSGVGKTRQEMEMALEAGILLFNIESTQEMEALNRYAGEMGKKAPVALRVNPDVDPRTHPYISTGLRQNKFGIDIQRSLSAYAAATRLPHLEVVGVDCHIGSQLTSVDPFVETLQRIKILMDRLKAELKINIRYLDLGGGLGITYEKETPPHPEDYAQALIREISDRELNLILEPGRVIVGNAGILVTRVLYLKEGEGKHFVIVDAGMNDLARPSLYGSYHGIQPVVQQESKEFVADVVGPICESGDFLAKGRTMPEVEPGDLLAVMSAGAYGFTMSSNYNARPRVPEILVKGDTFYVIRERETYQDLIRGEKIPV